MCTLLVRRGLVGADLLLDSLYFSGVKANCGCQQVLVYAIVQASPRVLMCCDATDASGDSLTEVACSHRPHVRPSKAN